MGQVKQEGEAQDQRLLQEGQEGGARDRQSAAQLEQAGERVESAVLRVTVEHACGDEGARSLLHLARMDSDFAVDGTRLGDAVTREVGEGLAQGLIDATLGRLIVNAAQGSA